MNRSEIIKKFTAQSELYPDKSLEYVIKNTFQHYCLDHGEVNFEAFSDLIKNFVLTDQSHFVGENLPKFVSGQGKNFMAILEYLLFDKKFESEDLSKFSRTVNNISALMKKKKDIPGVNKGLVFGQVQSGKTTHFSMVINAAIDNGIKNILIITSDFIELDEQTHERIRENVVGAEKSGLEIGVKKYRKDDHKIGILSDPKNMSSSEIEKKWHSHDVRILVTRKNTSTLKIIKNLLNSKKINTSDKWLVIDDEADNASIDTTNSTNDDLRTKINKYIVDFIHSEMDSAFYIGYTATPFANLLFKDYRSNNSLKPDWIQYISPGKKYRGVSEYFGSGLSTLDSADDIKLLFENRSWKDVKTDSDEKKYFINKILLNFFADSAYREVQQFGTKHDKIIGKYVMTVNIAHKKNEHNLIKEAFRDVVNKKFCDFKDDISSKVDFKRKIKAILTENYQMNHSASLATEYALKLFLDLAANVSSVEVINSDNNLNVSTRYNAKIIIGGFKIGRGLTIDNLTFFYLDRTSKNYDTILQQGRFFGYRKYPPTLLISQDYFEAFEKTAEATEELIFQLSTHDNSIGHFLGKIKFINKLKPTSQGKMGKKRVVFTSTDQLQGYRRKYNSVALEDCPHNKKKFIEFYDNHLHENIQKVKGSNKTLLIKDVSSPLIIEFLKSIKFNGLNHDFIEILDRASKKPFNVAIPSGIGHSNDWIKNKDLGMRMQAKWSSKKRERISDVVFASGEKLVSNSLGKPTDYISDNSLYDDQYYKNRKSDYARDVNMNNLLILYTQQYKEDSVNYVALEIQGANVNSKYTKYTEFAFETTKIESVNKIFK